MSGERDISDEDLLFATLIAERLALPDRLPDKEGQHRFRGHTADWSYWRDAGEQTACDWCGAASVGLVLTDAAGPQRLTVMGVCDRHRNPDLWSTGLWAELRSSFDAGAVHMIRNDALRAN